MSWAPDLANRRCPCGRAREADAYPHRDDREDARPVHRPGDV